MNLSEAIDEACAQVGIVPPRRHITFGKWIQTDTFSGKNGKGDGRVIADELRVTARNMQTAMTATVWLKDKATPVERRQIAERRRKDDTERRARAEAAAKTAEQIIAATEQQTHPYLARKGFPHERAMVISAADVRAIGGDYLVAGKAAIVMPARIGHHVSSVQLIWEDGSKKFLAGGVTEGTSHRIATAGSETWLCEGFATGLSLRLALKALSRSATILCCFSASNVFAVARSIEGRCFIAADNDPVPKADPFDGLGTAEHYARAAGRPWTMPPSVGTDFNDMHLVDGIFAVQRHLTKFMRGVSA